MPDQPLKPLEGLYGFIRQHLTMVNAVVLFASTLVGLIDFLSPSLGALPTVIYALTTLLVLLMLVAAWFPLAWRRVLSALGCRADLAASAFWRRPVWRLLLGGMVAVSLVGLVSVVHSDRGGLMASRVPGARGLQESLLGVHRALGDMGQGLSSANAKLDVLVAASLDPQKDLQARGYALDANGLMKAIKQGDRRAVALFVQTGYRVDKQGPLSVLINGHQPWDPELVSLLSPAMFEHPQACQARSLLRWALKPPAQERAAAVERLCGPLP